MSQSLSFYLCLRVRVQKLKIATCIFSEDQRKMMFANLLRSSPRNTQVSISWMLSSIQWCILHGYLMNLLVIFSKLLYFLLCWLASAVHHQRLSLFFFVPRHLSLSSLLFTRRLPSFHFPSSYVFFMCYLINPFVIYFRTYRANIHIMIFHIFLFLPNVEFCMHQTKTGCSLHVCSWMTRCCCMAHHSCTVGFKGLPDG